MEDVKIVALVPTRGDRPNQLANMHRMMKAQTKPLYGMVIVDDQPLDPTKKDITFRYKTGLTRIFEQYPECDLVALIEDDDWYSPLYLEGMCQAWIDANRPDTFGLGETYYYHLGIKSFYHQVHPVRASAFTTFMTRTHLNMIWPADDYSFVDIDIWRQFPGKTVIFENNPPAIGMKGYKEGQFFGGIGHNDKFQGYNQNQDRGMAWLSDHIDAESFEFYKSISDNLCV